MPGGRSNLLFIALVLLFGCQRDHKPFDQQGWADGDYRERGRMVNDLNENHALKGLSVEEATSLLGEPNDVDSTEMTLTWHLDLGWTGLFHMDLHIDARTQRVDSVRIWD